MSAGDLLLPFTTPFLVQAMLIAALVAGFSALLSCFLVLKGWSLMGDALSHAVLPGVVVSYMIGAPFAAGAFVAGMAAALAIGFLKENSRIKEDTVIGIVFSGFFALGLVLYTQIETTVHLDHILFGDVLGIGPSDLILAGAVGLVTVLVVAAKWRDLMLQAFDATHARAIGLPVRLLHYGFLAMLSLAIVGALRSVGIILAVALLVAPGATAFLLARRLSRMLLVAPALAVVAAIAGVYLSVFLDSAPAPTVVLLLTLFFLAAFLFSPHRGLLARRRDGGSALLTEPS